MGECELLGNRVHCQTCDTLIVGCGYLGRRAARRWVEQRQVVCALTRSAQRADELRQIGVQPIVGDVLDRRALAALPQADQVLYAVGYDRLSGSTMREVYVQGLANVLDAIAMRDATSRVLYISSTGVYGHHAGNWVDEHTPCQPQRQGGRVCLEAEQVLERHPLARRSIVLRLAGIYGPGRIPRRDQLASGRPIAAEPDVWLNLIHVDDAVRIVDAVRQCETRERLYLVSDGCPVLRRTFYEELSRQLGVRPPCFAEAEDERRSGATSRRISNRRLMNELRLPLQFPSYREGLAAILRQERSGG